MVIKKFDVVTSNPPYMNDGGGLKNEFTPKAIARHELLCTLEDIISNSAKVLKNDGRFYMIHRPHRLIDIIIEMRKYKLEPKKIRFVHSYVQKTAFYGADRRTQRRKTYGKSRSSFDYL